jgi:hypothetical protein
MKTSAITDASYGAISVLEQDAIISCLNSMVSTATIATIY